ncbi:subtilisin inhibitor-like [Nocardiopsis sp. Huas11]|uniref:SSI family serine proteinase inhibitor n=1 Tax=Nocardiopsis sp. Huas11 TaxID=2183912 RepID=UPI000EB17041|nr:SSI family serine proteinase inhibitor [Nocardiopsis sp. Huas11]RKS07401.1 subtilisin inhibitor-like [Nocardiopsis sp. Huas11]
MRRAIIATTTVVLALGLAAPAQADDTGAAAHYTLGLAVGDQEAQREATLICGETARGTHPHAERACELIAEAGSVEAVMVDPHGVCTLEYQPHRVTVSGEEEYTEVFGNKCRLTGAKGPIFDF